MLRVGGWGDLYYSLIQFDLSDPTLPRHSDSAVLRLYTLDRTGPGTPMFIDRITAFWDWKTQGTGQDHERLWFADLPPSMQLSATIARPGTLPEPVKSQFYDIDITDLYNFWLANPGQNFGLMLRPVVHDNNNFDHFLSADQPDQEKRPSLMITFTVPEPSCVLVLAVGLLLATGLHARGQRAERLPRLLERISQHGSDGRRRTPSSPRRCL
jgi:hypothetical protein